VDVSLGDVCMYFGHMYKVDMSLVVVIHKWHLFIGQEMHEVAVCCPLFTILIVF
jgi:hypothetical protein